MGMRHGGQILAAQLARLGVERVFSVPGESFLAALDGLRDSGIEIITGRHEGGVAMMAEAAGKLGGGAGAGVGFVTRGPGLSNAMAGLHVARQDSTPMVLFVGQIERGHRDREAFQEVNYRAVLGPFVKWVAEIDQTERIPEYVNRAFALARSGRPGPVVLALPEDMLAAEADVPDLAAPVRRATADWAPAARDIAEHLSRAERPLVLAGGPLWSQQAARTLASFAERQALPVATGFRRQDYIDNRHPAFVGDLGVGANPRLAARLREADLLLVLGSRLGDIETAGYTLLDPRAPGTAIVHVHASPDEPATTYAPRLAVAAPAPEILPALAALEPLGGGWSGWAAEARGEYEAWNTPAQTPGALKLEQVVHRLSQTLPDDAILTNGAGNFAGWLHRYFRYRRHGTQLAPTSGSMGYGFPAAIAAKLARPGATVVCLAGDGDFQMTLNELSTAVQYGAAVVVLVVNNGRYGTIRMHQEKHYPGRVSGTDLHNPDFAALARAYGGFGARVERTEDFEAAFDAALASGLPAVIDLVVDPEALSTGQTLSGARAAALGNA